MQHHLLQVDFPLQNVSSGDHRSRVGTWMPALTCDWQLGLVLKRGWGEVQNIEARSVQNHLDYKCRVVWCVSYESVWGWARAFCEQHVDPVAELWTILIFNEQRNWRLFWFVTPVERNFLSDIRALPHGRFLAVRKRKLQCKISFVELLTVS